MSKYLTVGVAVTALLLAAPEVAQATSLGGSVATATNVAFHRPRVPQQQWEVLRGGATDDEDEYDEFEDEYDSEEDDEEESAKLAASAVKATQKAKAKKSAASKKAMSSAMLHKKSQKTASKSVLKMLRVPYILRACLNPFIITAMTKAYFASLFNLNYLKEDESQAQGLRSALEEKAKRQGAAGGGKRGKRSMKPGQAKTISDLPQLG